LILGFLFGENAVAGLLPGALVSSVQLAISSSNSGGAWDNCKKYYESRKMKGTEEHKVKYLI
jgi:Na+/H+-translocating membrane pyrophosphatase